MPQENTNSNSSDALFKAISDRLMSGSGMVSSAPTAIESAINESIAGTRRAGEATAQRIESQFGRELDTARTEAGRTRTSVQEAQRGFGTNVAALNALDERTEKSLRDLEQRKQEALLAGEAATASSIAGLQFQAIQFKMQAEQQAFQNLLQGGTLALQARAEERAASQFKDNLNLQREQLNMQRDNAIATLASQYGVTYQPGDTIQTITARVAPNAKRKFESEISKNLKDTEKAATELNLDTQLTDLILGGASPVQAALQSLADVKAVGINTKPEDLNRAVARATEIQKAWKVEQDRTKQEVDTTSVWSKIGDFFNNRQSNSSSPSTGNDRAALIRQSVMGGFDKNSDAAKEQTGFFGNIFGL